MQKGTDCIMLSGGKVAWAEQQAPDCVRVLFFLFLIIP